jgi:hypothetical protein
MGEQNSNLADIENFLLENAKEISELKIELLKLHFEEFKKLQGEIKITNLIEIKTEGKRRVNNLIEVFENFKKNSGELYEYDADIFDYDDTEIEEIRTKNLLFSIVRSLYLILCNSKQQGELEGFKKSLNEFKFKYQDNEDVNKMITLYKRFFQNNSTPKVEGAQKVEKKSAFSRLKGIFTSPDTIEKRFNKIETDIKTQRSAYDALNKTKKEGNDIDSNFAVITAIETKFLELKEVKERIDKLNKKLKAKDIVQFEKEEKEKQKREAEEKIIQRNKKLVEESKVLESIKKGDATDKEKEIAQQKYNAIETNANEFITHFTVLKKRLDSEIANLNKKTLETEATKEKVAADEEFKALEETLNTEISGIQADIDKLKNNKGSIEGGKRIKYKSTGNEVVIFHKNRECRKTIYVKEKTTTKYCKINNKYILLSKLNVID